MKREVNKKGQGGIISVVLLILIVIGLAVIVMAFVIPFVTDKLSSGDCVDVSTGVKISSSIYTCYDDSVPGSEKMKVQVEIGAVRDLIDGFTIEFGGVTSQTFKLLNGTQVTSPSLVTMHDLTTIIKIPADNAATTYFFNNILTKPDFIKVYPILKDGKICGVSDTVTNIEDC